MMVVVIRLAEGTTHILQPCHYFFNRTFLQTVPRTRDGLLVMSQLSCDNTSYKIKMAMAGHKAILTDDTREFLIKNGDLAQWTTVSSDSSTRNSLKVP